jgi:hypothetical protein
MADLFLSVISWIALAAVIVAIITGAVILIGLVIGTVREAI